MFIEPFHASKRPEGTDSRPTALTTDTPCFRRASRIRIGRKRPLATPLTDCCPQGNGENLAEVRPRWHRMSRSCSTTLRWATTCSVRVGDLASSADNRQGLHELGSEEEDG